MRQLIHLVLIRVLAFSICGLCSTAFAGDLTDFDSEREDCNHVFSGSIEDNDLMQFQKAWIDRAKTDDRWAWITVCFDSLGGSFPEGIKIAKFLKEYGIYTRVRNGDRCLSACAIAFMGGTHRITTTSSRVPLRQLDFGGRLGFHRPSVPAEQRMLSAQIGEMLDTGMEVAAALHNLNLDGTISDYLYQRILNTGFDDMFFIDTNTKAALAEIDIPAVVPVELSNDHIRNLCVNAAFVLDSQYNVLADISERAFGHWAFGAFYGGDSPKEEIVLGRERYLDLASTPDEVLRFQHYLEIMVPEKLEIFEGQNGFVVSFIAGHGVYWPPDEDDGQEVFRRECGIEKLSESDSTADGKSRTVPMISWDKYGPNSVGVAVASGEFSDWVSKRNSRNFDRGRGRYFLDDDRLFHFREPKFSNQRQFTLNAPAHLIYPAHTPLSESMASPP